MKRLSIIMLIAILGIVILSTQEEVKAADPTFWYKDGWCSLYASGTSKYRC